MDVGSEEREQLHREGQVQPGGGFPAPVCSQARGVATPPPPAAAACLGTAGQSLLAFLWGPWALARVIQFLCCQENGISW